MKATQIQKCVIEVEDWQIQCCGTPFKLGDKVEWIVRKWAETTGNYQAIADYYYEHHSTEWQKLLKITGIVNEIKALYYSLEIHLNPSENHNCTHHRVYKKTVDVTNVDGQNNDIDELELGNYLVVLHNCIIRPAEEIEVTFS